MTAELTATDFFCGAGGSSSGLVAAGIEVKGAANHWKLAIETHNTNHPLTTHYLDDLQQAHPSWYPRTTIAWFSPECTNHSLAKGKKRKGIGQLDLWGESQVDPAEERSRATMREVVEFSDYHRYEVVIVENVVDIRHWQHYDAWLTAMLNMGYEHKILYLNAQFFGVPQSRDRFYAVFWKKGNKAPNLDFRPAAVCSKHGVIGAVQAFKKSETPWGRYGARRQYTYRCPQCGEEVMPAVRPASDIIDWSLPSEKIGERKKALKEKTIQRVLAGLKKFGNWPHVADLSYAKALPVDVPLSTETAQQRHALVQPFMLSYNNSESPPRPVDDPLFAITTGYLTRLVVPPFIMAHYNNPVYTEIDKPMSTVSGTNHHSLITPEEMLPECGFRMLEPHELKRGMSFPDTYIILGNKRDQVRQVGNAVCCNVAEAIAQRVVESLQ